MMLETFHLKLLGVKVLKKLDKKVASRSGAGGVYYCDPGIVNAFLFSLKVPRPNLDSYVFLKVIEDQDQVVVDPE